MAPQNRLLICLFQRRDSTDRLTEARIAITQFISDQELFILTANQEKVIAAYIVQIQVGIPLFFLFPIVAATAYLVFPL